VTLVDASPVDEAAEVEVMSQTAASLPDEEERQVDIGDPKRIVRFVVVGIVALVAIGAIVVYVLGPLVHDRSQRTLMAEEREAIRRAAAQTDGLTGVKLPTQPPVPGTAVGILDVPRLGIQQAVVEGVSSTNTIAGPGHVPGTAGLGQPGNAAVVGRRAGYGGPFGSLGQVQRGDRIFTATIEGESVYLVRSVRTVSFSPKLYAPTAHDQLTLVTSGSGVPWNANRALVVVAQMKSQPFTPTPQESRSADQNGNSGDPSAVAPLVLALLVLAAALAAATFFFRRTTVRAAYLLTAVPLFLFAVIAAEEASRLLPAWL